MDRQDGAGKGDVVCTVWWFLDYEAGGCLDSMRCWRDWLDDSFTT